MAGAIPEREAGFAAVDALTALAILATTIALSISALSVARRASVAASETNAARTTLLQVLGDAPRLPGVYSGTIGAFDWSLRIHEETPPNSPARLCRQRASLHGRVSGRSYADESRAPCGQTPAAS
jgi:hypothetical protein